MSCQHRSESDISDRALKFLMVTTFYPPYHFGGDALYVRQLAHVLAARGHTVDILHCIDAHQALEKNVRPAPLPEPAGIQVLGLKSAFPIVSSLLTQQTGRPVWFWSRIQSIFKKKQYDIIHYHNVSLIGGPGILTFGLGIKLYTAHEHWLVCPTHVLWRHNREPCTSRQCLRCSFRYRRPPQLWRATGLLESCARHVDAFVALSAFSAQKHREFGFRQTMKVIPSFIADQRRAEGESDSAIVQPAATASKYIENQAASGRPWFLFVGRLEKIKGLHDAISVFHEDIGADLCVVGTGAQRDELQHQAHSSSYIHFLGALPPDELPELYRQACAVVLPSICYEVFPLVALEAFQQGTPIIARQRGPFTEIIEDSGGGLLFKNNDELRQAVLKLASDPLEAENLGKCARRAFASTWSEHAAMQAYFTLIRQTAEKKQATSTLAALDYCSDDGRRLPVTDNGSDLQTHGKLP